MLYLDDLKYLRLYRKKFFLPIDKENKKKGSAILLLSPSYTVSNELMNSPFTINRQNSFQSYYLEKDIMYTIQHESRNLQCDYEPSGIGPVNEQTVFTETTDTKIWDSLDDIHINEYYCQLGDRVIFFNEMTDDTVVQEAGNVNAKYKTLLYNDRIRTNKVIFDMYDQVKQDNPWIKKTFINYARYGQLNLFIDLYYYNQAYLKNNNFNLARSVDMYFEFIRRFILDKRI